KLGMDYFVDIHVQAVPALSLRDAHILSGKVKSAIRRAVNGVIDASIHMEPTHPGVSPRAATVSSPATGEAGGDPAGGSKRSLQSDRITSSPAWRWGLQFLRDDLSTSRRSREQLRRTLPAVFEAFGSTPLPAAFEFHEGQWPELGQGVRVPTRRQDRTRL